MREEGRKVCGKEDMEERRQAASKVERWEVDEQRVKK